MKKLIRSIGKMLVAGVDYVTIEGRALINKILDILEMASRIALLWPLLLLLITLLFSPRWAQNIMPIITLIPVVPLVWLATNRIHLGTTILIETLPTNAPFKIGALVEKLQKAISIMMTILGFEIAFGIYCSVVPIANDRWLVTLLLAVIAGGICLTLGGRTGIAGIAWLGVIIITVIFFMGGRDKAAPILKEMVTGETVQVEGFNPDPEVICQNGIAQMDGHRIIIPLHKGCWTKFGIPQGWQSWRSQDANDDARPEDWVSFWYVNWRNPSKPARLNVDNGSWTTDHAAKAQGHGVVILYRTGSNN